MGNERLQDIGWESDVFSASVAGDHAPCGTLVVRQIILGGDLQVNQDLGHGLSVVLGFKSMLQSIRLKPKHRKYFGFNIMSNYSSRSISISSLIATANMAVSTSDTLRRSFCMARQRFNRVSCSAIQ